MRQKTISVYKFEELSEDIQQELIDENRWIGVKDGDWWEYIADEIEGLGGNLVQFDIYKGTIQMDIVVSPIEFAKAIVSHHGSRCDTYKISQQYLDEELVDKDYLHDISREYLSTLREEYEYLTSDEYVREGLIEIDNEYYEDGREI
jgi:hypothetical protein